MGFVQNFLCSTEVVKPLQAAVNAASFIRTGIQLTITIGTGPTLTETVIRLRIYDSLFVHCRKVTTTVTHILTSLYNDRPQSLFY
ncbi:hypothetical protein D3C72_2033980 [compost metagenome]